MNLIVIHSSSPSTYSGQSCQPESSPGNLGVREENNSDGVPHYITEPHGHTNSQPCGNFRIVNSHTREHMKHKTDSNKSENEFLAVLPTAPACYTLNITVVAKFP